MGDVIAGLYGLASLRLQARFGHGNGGESCRASVDPVGNSLRRQYRWHRPFDEHLLIVFGEVGTDRHSRRGAAHTHLCERLLASTGLIVINVRIRLGNRLRSYVCFCTLAI